MISTRPKRSIDARDYLYTNDFNRFQFISADVNKLNDYNIMTGFKVYVSSVKKSSGVSFTERFFFVGSAECLALTNFDLLL